MNKKGEEESHWGTVSAAVIIILAVVVVLLLYSDSSAEIKKGFEKFADKNAIDKAYKKTIGKESTLTEEEKKIIDEFNLFFRNNFVIKEDDCIKQINFNEIKGKGFGIGVRNGNVFAEKEERARVYTLIAPSRLAFYSDDVTDEFFIDENFEKINDKIELENVVYVRGNNIYFLDEFRMAVLKGFFSDIVKKNSCGEASERLAVANTEIEDVAGTTAEDAQDVVDYLNSEIEYFGANYKIYEIIRYLFDLNAQRDRGDFPIEDELNLLLNRLGEHIEDYFGEDYKLKYYGEDYRGSPVLSGDTCWRVIVDFSYAENMQTKDIQSYGRSRGEDLIFRKVDLKLSDGSLINFMLAVSKYQCLPFEVDKLLEPYRGAVQN